MTNLPLLSERQKTTELLARYETRGIYNNYSLFLRFTARLEQDQS